MTDEDVKKQRCTTCNGKGALSCEHCSGAGKLKCTTGVCATCLGTGKIPCETCDKISTPYRKHRSSRGLPCGNCIATGLVPCTTCGGSGKTTKKFLFIRYLADCFDCNGSGKEDCQHCRDGRIKCPTCVWKGVVTCPECEGIGHDRHCENCGGTGWLSCIPCTGSGTIPCSSCSGKGSTSTEWYAQVLPMNSRQLEFEYRKLTREHSMLIAEYRKLEVQYDRDVDEIHEMNRNNRLPHVVYRTPDWAAYKGDLPERTRKAEQKMLVVEELLHSLLSQEQ